MTKKEVLKKIIEKTDNFVNMSGQATQMDWVQHYDMDNRPLNANPNYFKTEMEVGGKTYYIVMHKWTVKIFKQPVAIATHDVPYILHDLTPDYIKKGILFKESTSRWLEWRPFMQKNKFYIRIADTSYLNVFKVYDKSFEKGEAEKIVEIHNNWLKTRTHCALKLFLDDYRIPSDVNLDNNEWAIVRNYEEFCEFIYYVGFPKEISFDHDLHEEHYTPAEYWESYEKSKEYQLKIYDSYKEKTGKGCAEWLVNYCKQRGYKLPKCHIHSFNPVGADLIKETLESYKRK